MNTCQHIRTLLPWYVNGTLTANEQALVADHVAQCESCREELATTLRTSLLLRQAIDNQPRVPEHVYEKVKTHKGEFQLGSIDMGSFLLGLSLGLSITRRGKARLTGNLRLFGKRVSIYDTKKREDNNGQE